MGLERQTNPQEDGDYSDSDSDPGTPPILSPRKIAVVPPIGFAMVGPRVYRSGHPFEVNFGLLAKLQLKTIIYLAEEDYPPENAAWCQQHNVTFYQYRVKPVRYPAPTNDSVVMEAALQILKERTNHPILLHSNKGKHRVGVLVGCMRKVLQGWDEETIHREYNMFAGDKGELDLKFISAFEPSDSSLRDALGWGLDLMRFPPSRMGTMDLIDGERGEEVAV